MTFNYKLTSYKDYLEQFAAALNTTIEDNVLTIPDEKGSGYIKLLAFGNNIEAIVYSMRFNFDLLFRREKDEQEYYTLQFDSVKSFSSIEVKIGNDKLTENSQRSTALYLSSYLHDIELYLSRNIEVRGFRVRLTPEWMKNYLKLEGNQDILEEYINLKASGIWSKPIGNESKQLFSEITENGSGSLLFYQNRIMRIVEIFFEWLYNESQSLTANVHIPREDIKSAQKVESILTHDVTVLPPTIKELAKTVAMSESKLKKIFKNVYGLPPYEYFQKQRMQKAKMMLLSGNYSIKDVGYTLGYSNLSNFTLAFKKEFGQLPSEVLKSAQLK
jgi:AraC-like DNA-binding protein